MLAVRCDVFVLLILKLIYVLERMMCCPPIPLDPYICGQVLRVPGRGRRAFELQSPPRK